MAQACSVRAPDHLGDGVMALPAIRALATSFAVEVHAPAWGRALYAPLVVRAPNEPPRAELGVLLKPSFGAAFRWRHLPRRVGLAQNGRGFLLTTAVPVPDGHRREGYAAVVRALGVEVAGLPRLDGGAGPGQPGVVEAAVGEPRPAGARLPRGFVGLNPWSPTPTVRWPGFRALADALVAEGRGVVFFGGPGEEAAVRAVAGPHPCVLGLSLPDFGAALAGCSAFVSNDSGAAHFAAACGAPVVMVHGSTAAERTGVGVGVDGGPLWCRPCYRKWCFNGLLCLERVGVEAVLGRVREVAGG